MKGFPFLLSAIALLVLALEGTSAAPIPSWPLWMAKKAAKPGWSLFRQKVLKVGPKAPPQKLALETGLKPKRTTSSIGRTLKYGGVLGGGLTVGAVGTHYHDELQRGRRLAEHMRSSAPPGGRTVLTDSTGATVDKVVDSQQVVAKQAAAEKVQPVALAAKVEQPK